MAEKEENRQGLEESFKKLEEMIKEMEKEDIPLEESFKLYSEGMSLLKHCNEEIDRVEKKVLSLNDKGETDEF
ncbi:MAG: exodeoxyribonuclease VII small subunit [Lachnospiraceae bacterium]|nr:exodeoxyribonuclease VII small subunit [Lachnospiraceae bacterium]